MSSHSPEHDRASYKLYEKPQTIEQARSRRSITAFLAAEVLLLEGILAAQNSKKVSKVKTRKVARPVRNHIHQSVSGKYRYPPVVKQNILIPIPTTVQTTTAHPVPQLDPFTMLTAPDLSRSSKENNKPYQAKADQIFYELITTKTQAGSKREAKQFNFKSSKYGEYELYNPTIVERGREQIVETASPLAQRNAPFERKV